MSGVKIRPNKVEGIKDYHMRKKMWSIDRTLDIESKIYAGLKSAISQFIPDIMILTSFHQQAKFTYGEPARMYIPTQANSKEDDIDQETRLLQERLAEMKEELKNTKTENTKLKSQVRILNEVIFEEQEKTCAEEMRRKAEEEKSRLFEEKVRKLEEELASARALIAEQNTTTADKLELVDEIRYSSDLEVINYSKSW